MNKQYEEVLARFLNGVMDTAEKLNDFAQSELPDVVQQALAWHFAYSIIMSSLGILIILAYISLMLWAKKKHDASKDYSVREGWLMFIIFGGMIAGAFTLMISAAIINLQWLKIWIAPKLWLIEYAAKLVK